MNNADGEKSIVGVSSLDPCGAQRFASHDAALGDRNLPLRWRRRAELALLNQNGFVFRNFLWRKAHFNDFCGNASDNSVWGNILCYNTSSRYY